MEVESSGFENSRGPSLGLACSAVLSPGKLDHVNTDKAG